ncbi:MAG: hypothetical protein KAQ96_02345, partial [Thermoplasmata archaeon]|nr:hypothetical protein [Thermoplasmata archaeon]
DNDPPYFGEVTISEEGTTGDPFTFTMEAMDNVGVVGVWVEYWYGELGPVKMNLSHTGDQLWEATITIEDTLEDLYFFAGIIDSSGNVVIYEDIVNIVDNDDPVIVEDRTPGSATTGDPFVLSVVVTDNIGVASVDVEYFFNHVPLEEGPMHTRTPMEMDGFDVNGNPIYLLTIDIPRASLVTLWYHFLAKDLHGNEMDGGITPVNIIDNDRPDIEFHPKVREALKGLPLTLSIETLDNIDVTEAFAIIRYGSGDADNLSMEPVASYSIEFIVPRDPEGDITVFFSARDEAGNWFSTVEFEIALVNTVPEVDDIPQWSITEELEATLDLAPYLSDGNDDVASLTVECND